MGLNFWSPKPLPENLPTSMTEAIAAIAQSDSQQEALRQAYNLLTGKYHGRRGATYLKLIDLFRDDVSSLWDKDGFMHCTNLNHLLIVLLVRSGQFRPEDIRLYWTNIFLLAPHQYAIVRFKNGQEMPVDVWSAAYGIKLGDYGHWFHAGKVW